MSQTFSHPLEPAPAIADQKVQEEYEYATEEYYEEEDVKQSTQKPAIKAKALEPEEIMASPA